MDGKRYLYSAPVVDVKIAAPPRASRETGAASGSTIAAKGAHATVPQGWAGQSPVPTKPRPNPTPKENPIEQVSRRRFCCFFKCVCCVLCAVCSWAGWRRGRRPRPISAGQTGSSRLDGGLPRAWLQRGGSQNRGGGWSWPAGETCSNRRSGCQGADGELGRELGPLGERVC